MLNDHSTVLFIFYFNWFLSLCFGSCSVPTIWTFKTYFFSLTISNICIRFFGQKMAPMKSMSYVGLIFATKHIPMAFPKITFFYWSVITSSKIKGCLITLCLRKFSSDWNMSDNLKVRVLVITNCGDEKLQGVLKDSAVNTRSITILRNNQITSNGKFRKIGVKTRNTYAYI